MHARRSTGHELRAAPAPWFLPTLRLIHSLPLQVWQAATWIMDMHLCARSSGLSKPSALSLTIDTRWKCRTCGIFLIWMVRGLDLLSARYVILLAVSRCFQSCVILRETENIVSFFRHGYQGSLTLSLPLFVLSMIMYFLVLGQIFGCEYWQRKNGE